MLTHQTDDITKNNNLSLSVEYQEILTLLTCVYTLWTYGIKMRSYEKQRKTTNVQKNEKN